MCFDALVVMGDTDAKISIFPILASLLLVSILRISISVCNNTSRDMSLGHVIVEIENR